MKLTRDLVDVMIAYMDGQQVQYYSKENHQWIDTAIPEWNWGTTDYRVKPKLKYVPFDNVREFLETQKVHGTILTNSDGLGFESSIDCHECVTLVSVCSNLATEESFETIFKNFTFQDGTPCGKEVEE